MGKYRPLAEWLLSDANESVQLSLPDVEEILGFSLPASAGKYQPFWSSNVVGSELRQVGWRARLRKETGQVEFSRTTASSIPVEPAPRTETSRQQEGTTPDVVLVGCVQTKRFGRHAARNLYTSTLFSGRRNYAEPLGVPWFILSGKYGLVAPDEEIDSYHLSLLDLSAPERRAWSERVLAAL